MLTEFSIGNYQAFSTPQRVPLKPITLIFGPNSAGKSSLLRSLLVARHAILNGKLSKSEGAGERHPGSFNVIARNGHTNPVSFDFLVKPVAQANDNTIGLRVEWKESDSGVLETMSLCLKKQDTKMVAYASKWAYKHLQIESLGDELLKFPATARLSTDTEGRLDEMVRHSFDKRLCLQKHNALPGADADDFRFETSGSDDGLDIVGTLDALVEKKQTKEEVGIWREALKLALNSSRNFIQKAVSTVNTTLRECLTTLDYHGPMRPICDEIRQTQSGDPGMSGWWNLAADPKLLAKVNEWLNADVFKTKFRLEFDRLFSDSSLQQLLKSLSGERSIEQLVEASFEAKLDSDEQFYESIVDSVAPDLEQYIEDEYEDESERSAEARQRAHDVIHNDLWDRGMEHYNEILDNNDLVEIESFLLGGVNQILSNLRGMLESVRKGNGTKTSGGFDSAKVRFCDLRSNNSVSPSNMGIGFSQMMPLVASAFGSENRLIAIEQPELHIHPALQTELADLFIQSAKERGNRFLIETHSEHLILRVMRRIRETSEGKLPEGKQPITTDDVCVLYVEPGENGSIVREMPLNERGELVKGWPGGFFEEALNELF